MWEEILKVKTKIKMHIPTLKIKVAEWAEMNREGRHRVADIINYIKEDVARASVEAYIKKNPHKKTTFNTLLPIHTDTITKKGIHYWATHISGVLKKMGFKKYSALEIEREAQLTNEGRWQDIVDHNKMRQAIRREGKAPESRRYGGSASRFEENR